MTPLLRVSAALLLAATCFLVPSGARAGGGPENLALVVNADSPDSVAVAQEYVRLRQVPACNVINLRGLPTAPVIPISAFKEQILRPVIDQIRQRGLEGQIDYIVYSAGFPYAVDIRPDMAGKQFATYITQPASFTGLTYLADMVLAGDTEYLSMDSNRYFRRIMRQKRDTAWTAAERKQAAEMEGLFQQFREARQRAAETKTALPATAAAGIDRAAVIARTLARSHPNNAAMLYDLACLFALKGDSGEAMRTLQAAFAAGWTSATYTDADPDLANLRTRADYRALLEQMRKSPVATEPAVPFQRSTRWLADGGATRRYYLSAMLAYIGPVANTRDEALECLRRSAAADGTHPSGTVYFMASSDVARTGPRQWAFNGAAAGLARLGVKGEALSGVLPPTKPDVAGAVVGIATFSWKDSGSRILPGAFCDHLTSCGGIMTGGGQTLLSEFLRNGAAGACGTVAEPYNVQQKFPTAFLHVYYASGCSLAEAFYQSVSGPYQQLLVGDPLCRPWARIPAVKVAGLGPGQTVKGTRALAPRSSDRSVVRYELFLDGRRVQTCVPGKSLTLKTAGLAPGPHEARVVAVAGPLETIGRAIIPFGVR